MNWEVFVTCAVTGSAESTSRSPHVPVTPEQIAAAALEAAQAGAAIAHIHVRDPKIGSASRDVALYREVVERIRASDIDVVINLTGGMGGDLFLGGHEAPLPPADGTDMVSAKERLAHVSELLPEICTLDFSSMNFGSAGPDYVQVNTPAMLREMSAIVQRLGVRPEFEVFDTGDLVLVKEILAEGLIDNPALIQLCSGIPYGVPADPLSLIAMINALPSDANFSAFAIGRMQMPLVSLAAILGGNVRVGLEDNLYLSRGVLATNRDLVERAVEILERMNVRILGPSEVRERLSLRDPRGSK